MANGDPMDVTVWSGTPYFALQALQKEFDVAYVERRPFPRKWLLLRRVVLRLTKRRLDLDAVPAVIQLVTLPARRRLLRSNVETIVSIASSQIASMLPATVSQVLITDATSKALLGYYERQTRMWPRLQAAFIAMETRAMRNADVVAYPSRWAQRSAIEDFGLLEASAVVIPWGPNITKPDGAHVRTLNGAPQRLLFVGVEWQRKGGAIAVEAARLLKERGYDCHLDIAGVDASVAAGDIPDNVTFHGKLRKSEPAEAAKLLDLFERAHLFVLPTKAEAYGLVFAEAAAWGIPSISYATGGVTTVVQDQVTGILLDPTQGAESFADAIANLSSDPDRYEAMSAAALKDSHERLDWSVWARELRCVIGAVR